MTVDYSMFRDPFKNPFRIHRFTTPDDTNTTADTYSYSISADSMLFRYRPNGSAYARIFRYWRLRGEEFIREITKIDPRRRFSDTAARYLWETQREKFKIYREGTYEF